LTPVLISRRQIRDYDWNHLIQASRQGAVYALTDYLDIVCESWQAFVWPGADDYQIIMPVPVKRRLGVQAVCQPLYCQYLGIFSKGQLTVNQVDAFLLALTSCFRFISRYCFNPDNSGLLNVLRDQHPALSFNQSETVWLDLSGDYGSVFSRYSGDRRLNLRRGCRFGWVLISSSNVHPLIYLFSQNHASKIPGGVSPVAYDLLDRLFEFLSRTDSATLWYACKDGRIRAGVLICRFQDKAIYLFNAADNVGRRGNARTFLLDHFFIKNSGTPTVFDFESPDVPAISSYYRSFGGEVKQYFAVRKNTLWLPLKLLLGMRNLFFKTIASLS
jgi:hypothetical protein